MKYSEGIQVAGIIALAAEISDEKFHVHVEVECTPQAEVRLKFYRIKEDRTLSAYFMGAVACKYTLDEMYYILAAISGLETAK